MSRVDYAAARLGLVPSIDDDGRPCVLISHDKYRQIRADYEERSWRWVEAGWCVNEGGASSLAGPYDRGDDVRPDMRWCKT